MVALRMTRHESARLRPDPGRVIAKPFLPGEEYYPDGSSRIQVVVERILAMSDAAVAATLDTAWERFADRHRDLDAVLDRNFTIVAERLHHRHIESLSGPMSGDRRRLVGAYFTHEYSIEGAALGNPSIVAGPDQSGLDAGEVRFVMSLRAIGEGHLSSIEFRSGVIGQDATITLDPPSRYAVTGDRTAHAYDKASFTTKLEELGMLNEVEEHVLDLLPDRFTMEQLEAAIESLDEVGIQRSISGETTHVMHWLAASNYTVAFPSSPDISERVLFPSGATESHGMEDARFVRFVDDDGEVTYVATYTAFDGHQILPQLVVTDDFTEFRISTLSGRSAQNKGIALFPRRIDGEYVALGRHDNVNNFVMTSTDIRVWRDATVIQEPRRPWELVQLGNCGSPIETDAGWLVITHGVGPFRQYAIGALLLDLADPSRVIGHLADALLGPDDDEREGYVPNVVYSCGGMVHGEHLVLPYGYADVGASVATVPLDALLDRLAG